MRKIGLVDKERVEWVRLRGRAANAVRRAVRNGDLVNLKTKSIKCTDCPNRAAVYDHRDYKKPLKVEPVCVGCNISRGTNAPLMDSDSVKPKCTGCGSSQVYFRQKTSEQVCRVCGSVVKK